MSDAPERIWVSETPGQNLPYPEERRGAWTTNVGQHGNQVEYIRADLCRPEPQGWQPIETAPKDGTRVLAYWPDCSCQVESWFGPWLGEMVWQSEFEWGSRRNNPTHWMPLLEPPKP